jgi:hypothetical protein
VAHYSASERVSIRQRLGAKPGSVNLRWTDGDPEALYLAIQVSHILAKSKWQLATGSVKPLNAIVFGITIPDAAGNDVQTLREAFSAGGVAFSTRGLPPKGRHSPPQPLMARRYS